MNHQALSLRTRLAAWVGAAAAMAREGADAWRREGPWHRWCLLAIVAAAAVVRVLYLTQPMRFDESFTVTAYASEPLTWSLSAYYYPNNHLLHTVLVHGCIRMFGDAPWAVRLPALLAGVLTVPAGYTLARAWFGRQAGLWAAACLAGSSMLVEFSVNARGYSLTCLLMLLLWLLAERVRRRPSGAAWAGLAVTCALAVYTIPFMFHGVGVVMAWLAISALAGDAGPRRRFLRAWLLSGLGAVGLALLLYLPIVLRSGPASLVANRFVHLHTLGDFLRQVRPHLATLWEHWHRDLPPGAGLVLVAGLVAAIVLSRRMGGPVVSPGLAAVLWLVPANLAFRAIYMSPRVWLFLLPVYLVLGVGGLAWLARLLPASLRQPARRSAWLVPLLAAALCGNLWRSGSVTRSEETGTARQAEPLALFLRSRLQSGDRVAASDLTLVPLIYYLRHHGIAADWRTPLDRPPRRVLVAVDHSRGETLEGVLAQAGNDRPPPWWPAPAAEIGRIETLTIHEVAARKMGSE